MRKGRPIGRGKGGGRPTVMTKEVVGLLRTALSNDLTIEEACSVAKISKDSYYERLKKDPKFADQMASAKLQPVFLAKKVLIQAIRDGNGTLALRFLERRMPERYGLRREHDENPLPPNTIVVLPGSHPHPRIIPQKNDPRSLVDFQ